MLMVIFHTGKAILPGVNAYTEYFQKKGWEVHVLNYGDTIPGKVAVEWHFMGTKGKRIFHGSLLIHEYASTSVPPFAWLKDIIKRSSIATPDLRIFLNEQVKSQLNFSDTVPFRYRDIGIPSSIIKDLTTNGVKEFDFIFTGSMHPYPVFRKLLKKFTEPALRSSSLLILSNNYKKIARDWEQYSNIKFQGPVPNDEVFSFIKRARYGINLRPAVAPFTYQTSTKVLEYIACRIPVISSRSHWITSFKKTHGGNYFILNDDLSNLDIKELERFPFAFPELNGFSWDEIISNSGIEEFILSKLKEE